MRKLLVTLIILIAVVLLIPFVFGFHTQYLLNEINGLRIPIKEGQLGVIEIDVNNYHRGWFKSRAIINVSYEQPSPATASPGADTPEADADEVTFLISHISITHGPILWRPGKEEADRTAPFFGQAWIKAPIKYVAESFSDRFIDITGAETGNAMGFISLLGNQALYLDTNEISFLDAKGQINFSGFHLQAERSTFGKELAAILNIPHLNFVIYGQNEEKSGIRWVMDTVEMEFDGMVDTLDALWFGTWIGELGATVDSFQLDVDGEHFAVTKFGAATLQKAGTNDKLLDGKGEVDIENVTLNQQTIGPIEFLFNFENIDKKAVEYMRGTYNEWLYSDMMEPFITSLSPNQRAEFYNQLLAFVNYLPAYQIEELSIITPQGDLMADFSVNIAAPATEVAQVENVAYWQQNINASFDLNAAKPLTETWLTWAVTKFYGWLTPLIPPMSGNNGTEPVPAIDYHAEAMNLLSQGMALGIIKPADDEYVSAIHYKQGLLTINDKTFIDWSKAKQQ